MNKRLIITSVVFVVMSTVLALQAKPAILESLSVEPSWRTSLSVTLLIFSTWWSWPLWILIPSILFVLWCGVLIMVYRPCLPLPTNKETEDE